MCGGFAVAHYGFIRATMDFDLLVLPDIRNAQNIMAALREFGFGDAGISEEAFWEPGIAVTLGAQPNQIDLLTSMSSKATSKIIAGAQSVKIKGLKMNVVSFEDLLFAKKESKRAKDRIDVEELLKLQQGN